ncbi:MAG: hypothetical protein IAF08_07300, partial [Rhizobacter sp.]|nr:hypothetical protein [Chlorobiales bacterium]
MLRIPLVLCAMLVALTAAAPPAMTSFKTDVQPIISVRCVQCHLNGKTRAKLSLETYESILKGGNHGPAINKDQPLESNIWMKISQPEPPFGNQMPLGKEPLSAAELKT